LNVNNDSKPTELSKVAHIPI